MLLFAGGNPFNHPNNPPTNNCWLVQLDSLGIRNTPANTLMEAKTDHVPLYVVAWWFLGGVFSMYHCKNRTFSWWLSHPFPSNKNIKLNHFSPRSLGWQKKQSFKPTPGGAIGSLLTSLETLCLQR